MLVVVSDGERHAKREGRKLWDKVDAGVTNGHVTQQKPIRAQLIELKDPDEGHLVIIFLKGGSVGTVGS